MPAVRSAPTDHSTRQGVGLLPRALLGGEHRSSFGSALTRPRDETARAFASSGGVRRSETRSAARRSAGDDVRSFADAKRRAIVCRTAPRGGSTVSTSLAGLACTTTSATSSRSSNGTAPAQRFVLTTGEQCRRPGWRVLTQQRGRAFSPLGGEIAERVLLLRGPSLERGLLPELPHQLRGRLPPVLRDVVVDQPVFDLLDIASTGRELVHQLLRRQRFPCRGAPAPRSRASPDAEDLSEMVRRTAL